MTISNLHLMQQYNNLWRPGQIDLADRIIDPGFTRYGSSGCFRGVHAFKRYVTDFLGAFPDISFTVEDCVAQGEKVVLRYGFKATHRGDFMGIQPMGNEIVAEGVAIYRIVNGKIVELWDYLDMLGLVKQMRAFPFEVVNPDGAHQPPAGRQRT